MIIKYNIELKEVKIKKIIVPKKIISVYFFDKSILSCELPIKFKISYEKNVPINVKKIDTKNAYINE